MIWKSSIVSEWFELGWDMVREFSGSQQLIDGMH
jgi:hypothetical protein